MTLGQILASVAVSTAPIGFIMRSMRGTESAGDLVVAMVFCAFLTLLCEAIFWGLIVPLIGPLDRALGRPSWFRWEVVCDPEGISWVDERAGEPSRRTSAGSDDIHWLE
jgi:hypothetical protein